MVLSFFFLIVVVLRVLGGKCYLVGLDFLVYKGFRECFVSFFGWSFWVFVRN